MVIILDRCQILFMKLIIMISIKKQSEYINIKVVTNWCYKNNVMLQYINKYNMNEQLIKIMENIIKMKKL